MVSETHERYNFDYNIQIFDENNQKVKSRDFHKLSF